MAEEAMRLAILGASALACGVALWSAVRHLLVFWEEREFWNLWFAMLLGGVIGIVALVGQLVFASDQIPLTWQAFAYGASLTMTGIGMIGLLTTQRPRRRA